MRRLVFVLGIFSIATMFDACRSVPATRAPASAEPSAAFPADVVQASNAVTSDDLRAHIAKISSDEFEGRGTATRGDRAARAYLAGELAALGVLPGRGSAWEQEVELVGVKS